MNETTQPTFEFSAILAKFLPLILEYNQELHTHLINCLMQKKLEKETVHEPISCLDNLLFAKASADLIFLPIGEPSLDEYHNIQLHWETPINLLHQKGFRDELSFVLYNASKNEIEHKAFNYVSDETTVDFTFIGLNDQWEGDLIYLWAIWSRYVLACPAVKIANSTQYFLGHTPLKTTDDLH
ncbi:MAG: hypothetical protein LBE34_00355 [Flavobacteriaceae bacterium]|nr:hypothetical protein [Flavobacteriaceae bacterium]